jgi:hypothetical protein
MDPIRSNGRLLFEGVYLAMGEDYLRSELRKRKLSDAEIEEIVSEIKAEQAKKEGS